MQKLTSFIDQGCRVLLGDIFAEYLQNTEVAIFQLILTAPLLQATIIMADHPQEVLPMIGDQVMVDENLGTPIPETIHEHAKGRYSCVLLSFVLSAAPIELIEKKYN
jgi:hypothetical protein